MKGGRRKPEYAEAAERFLALVYASRMYRHRLMEESGVRSGQLVHYENGGSAPRDAFAKNSEFSRVASAFKLLPSALVAWWATDDDRLLPSYTIEKIAEFRALSAKERLRELQLLGWQRPQGKQPKQPRPPLTAPPRAANDG